MKKILELVEKEIKCIEESESLNEQSLAALDKLIDIKKDIYEIEGKEDEEMRYGERYGTYGGYGARRRDSRGRYMEGNRNSGRYNRGSEYLGRMEEGYEDYSEGMDRYRASGNYEAHDKGMEALEYMLESVVEFVENLQENADSPEEVELIKKYARKIKEM